MEVADYRATAQLLMADRAPALQIPPLSVPSRTRLVPTCGTELRPQARKDSPIQIHENSPAAKEKRAKLAT